MTSSMILPVLAEVTLLKYATHLIGAHLPEQMGEELLIHDTQLIGLQ